MMKNFILVICFLFVLCSCSEQQTSTDIKLEKSSFADLKDFDRDDMLTAYGAFIKGCKKISTQQGEYLSDSLIKINLADYKDICQKAASVLPADFKNFVKNNFTPYLVTFNGSAEGKFTSYYESELRASFVKNDIYKYPVYGRPYDLVEANLSDFDATLPAKKLIGRVENGKFVPYYTRAQINRQQLNAPVIIWADSYIDIYIMQIQGSAVAYMADGNKIRIAYAQNNGRPFKGIGSILLQKGLLEKGQASMGSIKKWLKDNPDLAQSNMDENDRYIFHQLGNPEGPVGALGVPLTAGRSLAVDKSVVPLGALLWLETSAPNEQELNKLVLAQDIGGAIKGAVRGDYFWGSGGDEILELAGKMNSKGQYFILIPNKTENTNG